jgi:cyclase
VNSAALGNPSIISESAENFGRQCVVVAIDAKKNGNSWEVYSHGGTIPTGLDAVEWAGQAEDLGAGEILLTSVDADGVKEGYNIPLNAAISDSVNIPVIASGGCGNAEHIYEVFARTNVSAALAASIFHSRQYTVDDVKAYLRDKGVAVR